jgi:hypothetical protein
METMMLRTVRYQCAGDRPGDRPQLRNAVVNTEIVASIVETDSGLPGRWSRLRTHDGEVLLIEGPPEEFLGDLA